MTDGIYCLANDGVFDWMVALLASLRAVAPDLPVVVIPYDDRVDRVSSLRSIHPFELWRDTGRLAMLDDVGHQVNPRYPRTFRKLGVFWGPLDRFVFVDSDIIVSRGIQEVLRALEPGGLFLCGDLDIEQVFLPTALRREVESTGKVVGFNSGFFASTREALSAEEISAGVAHIGAARSAFVTSAQEQPFLNWCVWRSDLTVTPVGKAVADATDFTGAGRRPLRKSADGTIRVFDPRSDDYGRRMMVVHWAGFRCTSRMPNRKLFLDYRLGQTSAAEQARFVSRWALGDPVHLAKTAVSRLRRHA